MLQRQADKTGRKVAFLHPLAIVEKRYYGPMLWKDDHDEFKNCQSRKEINEVQKAATEKSLRQLVCTYRFSFNSGRTRMSYGHHITFSKCSLNDLV